MSLQVFQSFIDGFGVYGPLLTQVKRVFDQAIQDGLNDALDNSKLRQQLLDARREQAAAEAAARAEVIDGGDRSCSSVWTGSSHMHHMLFQSSPYTCEVT